MKIPEMLLPLIQPGHFVRDCPSRDAVGDTGGRKPKPGYVCRACGSEEHYLDDCSIMRQTQRGERRSSHRGPPKEIARECPTSLVTGRGSGSNPLSSTMLS
jgi:hypothetical protein